MGCPNSDQCWHGLQAKIKAIRTLEQMQMICHDYMYIQHMYMLYNLQKMFYQIKNADLTRNIRLRQKSFKNSFLP